jgi:homoserine dehydrogenase
MKTAKVGLLGFGTVGAGVARLLLETGDRIEARTGLRLVLEAVCDVDTETDRGVALPPGVLSDKLENVTDAHDIDVVVELIGGTDAARDAIVRALDNGKHVVTANKALLAEHGRDLFRHAAACRRSISFEASVCGGIPLVRAVRDGFSGDDITEMMGTVNGTCNYILTRMSEGEMAYADALADAQARGYAEADPTLDVSGQDSAHKLAVLAGLAFASDFELSDIHVEGIADVEPADIAFGREMGYVLKLLAVAKKDGNEVDLRVHPAFQGRQPHPCR